MNADNIKSEHHIVPLKAYFAVAAALLVLTAVTVAVSFIPLGGFNVVVALSIAAVKAALVAMIFMHLLYDKKIYLIVFAVAIIFLAIFIILTMFDTMNRGDFDESTAGPIKQKAIMYDSVISDSSATIIEVDSAGAQTETGE